MQLIDRNHRQLFNHPHHVIAEEPHRARGKRRQSRQLRRRLPLQRGLQLRKNIPCIGPPPAPLNDRNPSIPRGHLLIRTNPDKRIPPHLLATLHRLQQKRLRLLRGHTQKRGDRSLQVGSDRPRHRHQRVFTGKPLKLAKGRHRLRVRVRHLHIIPRQTPNARGRLLFRLPRRRRSPLAILVIPLIALALRLRRRWPPIPVMPIIMVLHHHRRRSRRRRLLAPHRSHHHQAPQQQPCHTLRSNHRLSFTGLTHGPARPPT